MMLGPTIITWPPIRKLEMKEFLAKGLAAQTPTPPHGLEFLGGFPLSAAYELNCY
jgi:hypothetical protein